MTWLLTFFNELILFETIKKPRILSKSGFLNEKAAGFGPAALRFYVSLSQKPSSGPLQYEYYYEAKYDGSSADRIVMGHIFTVIREM